jgi:uncharacterized membrane protein
VLPTSALRNIEAAIRDSEARHYGELRFVVEANLALPALMHGVTARERAIELFSQLRIWDTEQNSGVLIYLLLADRDVEIIADRGINKLVGSAQWETICQQMEQQFRQQQFEAGVIHGIRAISELLIQHFPASTNNINELPDTTVVL